MGYFDEDVGETPNTPHASNAMKRQVGAFFVAWGAVERELEVGFHVVFRLDPNLASSIYANLGTQAKIDILTSAIDTLWNALGARRVNSAHAILARIRILNDRGRNTLAHGIHGRWVDEKTGKRVNAVIRSVARKQMTFVIHPGSARYWKRMTLSVETTAKAMHRNMRSLHLRLKKFTDDEIWDLTGLQSKKAEPVRMRRNRKRL